MLLRLTYIRSLAAPCAAAVLITAALLMPARPALAFPPPGDDTLPVTGSVSVSSRIGQETIALNGTVTIERGGAQMQGGVEVVPAEIVALSLSGNSVTGPIVVIESNALTSSGELRALQSGSSYPASSFFDVYVTVTAPASTGTPTVTTITLSNNAPLHMVASGSLYEWPPASASYAATPNPCVALTPALPKEICITDLSFKISVETSPGVGGIASLPEPAGAAAGDRSPSGGDRAAGVGIGLGGLLCAGLAGWYARRLLAR